MREQIIAVYMAIFGTVPTQEMVIDECTSWLSISLFVITITAGVWYGSPKESLEKRKPFFKRLLMVSGAVWAISIVVLVAITS